MSSEGALTETHLHGVQKDYSTATNCVVEGGNKLKHNLLVQKFLSRGYFSSTERRLRQTSSVVYVEWQII